MIFQQTVFLFLAGLLLMIPPKVNAGIFLELPDVPGESRDLGFKGWIDIDSMGIEGHLRAGAAGSIKLVKKIDLASGPLTLALAKGKVFSRATLVLQRSGPDGPTELAKIGLKDIWISGVSQEGWESEDEGTITREVISLSFRQIFYSYIPLDGEKVSSYVEADEGLDTDLDGMSDSFEDFFGFDKTKDDGGLDKDGDGFTNRQEFRLGLNPISARSTFQLNAVREPSAPGKVKLRWEAKPGKMYRILSSQTLGGKFELFRDVSAKELTEEIDLGALGLRGFYRIEETSE